MATDAGSTVPGPAYLGSGLSMTHREGLKQSLARMLAGTRRRGIPLLIGSAGFAGRREQVDLFRDLIVEIARERELPRFKLATIYADVPRQTVKDALAAGRIRPLGLVPQLTEDTIDATAHLMAMMGAEPHIAALERVAAVVRSKNAGPFELCIDILFPDRRSYDLAGESPALTPASFAKLYHRAPGDCRVIWFPAAHAVKCTMPRAVAAGDPADVDVYGAQLYRQVLDLRL